MFWGWLVAAACAPQVRVVGEPDARIPADFVVCQADAECAIVELGCCDTCNGGWMMSVRADHVEAARARWGDDCGGGFACTELGCVPDPAAVCYERRCVVRLGEVLIHNPATKRGQRWPAR
jgi:hypothetical protein